MTLPTDGDDFCVQVPTSMAIDLVRELPDLVRRAPSVRADPGSIADAIQIGLGSSADIATLIVAGVGANRFARRVVASLRARGESKVTVSELPGDTTLVDVSEAALLAELHRRLGPVEEPPSDETGS